jgi:putative membrane protein
VTEVSVSVKSGSGNSSKQRSAGACEPTPQGKAFRIRVAAVFLVGVGVSAALIAYHSFLGVARGVRRVGWGLGFIIALYFLGIALNSLAWRGLFQSERPGLFKTLFPLRWIRESINYLLPSAVFGGDIVGGRLLVGRGYDMNVTTASIVVDKTLEAAGLFFFVLAGIFILLGQGGNDGIAHWAVRGLAVISALLIAFLLAQRWGFLRLVDKAEQRLAGKCGVMPEDTDLHGMVWKMYADGRRLTVATFFHTLAWMPGVIQVWLALRFMGHEIGWQAAFVVESIAQVICAAAFVMPASLGAQEAAYMTVGMFFGVPPTLGLALSLVQRLKDVVVGILGLLLWQGFEGSSIWKLWKSRRHDR